MHTCIRCIDLKPGRAWTVPDPTHYLRSSYRAHAGLDSLPWLAPVAAGGCDHVARVRKGVREADTDLTREAVDRGQLTEKSRFIDQVESALAR